ncbi:hypothetical protein BGX38DRAFT_1262316 [Terfezia claveryi]|nr:hypothetical protein BGX38DRAFT_1262316 [Terfezia claveryi]
MFQLPCVYIVIIPITHTQKYWLHKIGKSDSSVCPCGHQTQDGEHLIFHCPDISEQRTALGSIKDWEDLDRPIWVKEEDGDDWDAVEAFFGFLYRQMVGMGTGSPLFWFGGSMVS